MYPVWKKMKDESAGVVVENVVVLPIVFVVIFFMIVSAFLLHDRVTVETAARRGAMYAAHCVADPNYASLVGITGELDYSGSVDNSYFSSIGDNIKAYRYIVGGGADELKGNVEAQVSEIVNKTRINWIPQENIEVECIPENKIIYQTVTVQVSASYHLPQWFGWFGLETQYTVETRATLAAVDPDEFIRNADLVVDIITKVDNATGGYLEKAISSISSMAEKLIDWIEMD